MKPVLLRDFIKLIVGNDFFNNLQKLGVKNIRLNEMGMSRRYAAERPYTSARNRFVDNPSLYILTLQTVFFSFVSTFESFVLFEQPQWVEMRHFYE